jgi:hypothetical protein
MAIRFSERPLSQESTAKPPSIVYHYTCYGTTSTSEVQATAFMLTPAAVTSPYGILYRQDIRVEPEAADHWHVIIPYANTNGSFHLSFDTTGGTVNRKVSIGTVNSYKATGEGTDPPDYKGAIDVQDDGSVNGVDIVIPALKLNVHFRHPQGIINGEQIKQLARMAGTVNSTNFLGYEVGEVLFIGVSGIEGTDTETEITYQFACSENLSDATMGPFTGITKAGWDHAWVKFKSEVAGGNPVIQPRWLYVEKVYYRKPFAAILGFGA